MSWQREDVVVELQLLYGASLCIRGANREPPPVSAGIPCRRVTPPRNAISHTPVSEMPFRAAWNSWLGDSQNSAKWIWGLSCTRWLGLNVGLHVNPAAMAWLIHNTIRLHHLVQRNNGESNQVLRFSIRPTFRCPLTFCTRRHAAVLLNDPMPCRNFIPQVGSLDFRMTSATF